MGATEEELARLSVEEFEVAADADAETTTTTTSGEGEGTRRHRPTVSDLLKCQFHVWYPKFGPKYAGKVQTLELEQAFLDYLKQDGISVPENSRAFARPDSASSSTSSSSSPGTGRFARPDTAASSSSSSQATDGEEDDCDRQGSDLSQFSELMSKIDHAISSLGGSVMPTLNWSCPKDATWINPVSSLRCDNADEVVLMLKASDRILHDILHCFEDCVDHDAARGAGGEDELKDFKYILTLRKWYDFDRRRELRCFVVDGVFRGASQRYVNEDTSNLKDQKEEIMERVVDFFERVVQKKVELSSYCFDLFISRDLKPIVIDIGPLDEERLPSDRLLDLISPEEAEQHPSEKSLYGFPVDFLDMV